MRLYLVQHGKAVVKDEDPERPLDEPGRVDIERLGGFLKQADIRVERVIHSGKLRARQTAECLAEALSPMVELETSGRINPNDDPRLFDWRSESLHKDTLIVGHLPFMAKLVSYLLVGDENRPVAGFQPGSIVCLEGVDSNWQIGWMIRPELLR